jgi:hypothetical protein
MSTFVYAALTAKRKQAEPGKSFDAEPPGMKSYVDTVAALVPAEVLAIHALILPMATKSEIKDGQAVTTITDPGGLKLTFVVLILACLVLYFLVHRKKWDWWDVARIAVAPLAFVCWTMLQKTTAFDAVAPGFNLASRYALALAGAAVLAAASVLLARTADAKQP